jgi:succinate dehydrogenase/fumarate reductase cytochrome b subunit (b558 family)
MSNLVRTRLDGTVVYLLNAYLTVSAPAAERLRRLHALAGVLPLGLFVVEHLVLHAKALRGQVAFDRTIAWTESVPLWSVLEVVFVLLPLAFHALYGVVLLVDKKRRAEPSPYEKSWRVLVRGSAWVALVFIAYHVIALRVPRWTHALPASHVHTLLTAHLSTAAGDAVLVPYVAIFYLVGVAACLIHFAAGGWAYLVREKHLTSPLAIKRAAYAWGALAVSLFVLASLTVIGVASGAPAFLERPPSIECPQP